MNSTRSNLDGKEIKLLVGCSALYSVGGLIGWLPPQIMFGAMHHYSATATQAGLLPLVEGVTVGIVTSLLGARPPQLTHRTLAICGLFLFVLVNLASWWAPSLNSLVALRCLAGMADATLLFVGVSLIAMCSKAPDRSYSLATIAMVAVGAFVVASPPLLVPQVQGLVYLPFIAVIGVIASPFVLLLPDTTRPGRIASETAGAIAYPERRARFKFLVLLAFMAPACFQAFMLFAFSPSIGQRIGLTEAGMNSILGAATLASIVGPLTIIPIVKRIGHWWALMVAGIVLTIANLLLVGSALQWLFIACLIFNIALLYFIIPLLLGWCAEIDPSGRYSSIMMGLITMVTAFSPIIAGFLIDLFGIISLFYAIIFTGLLYSASLIFIYERRVH